MRDRRRGLLDGLGRKRVVELPAVVGNATRRGRPAGVERHVEPAARGYRFLGGRQGPRQRDALHAAVREVAPLLLVPVEVPVDHLVVLGAVRGGPERGASHAIALVADLEALVGPGAVRPRVVWNRIG